jgi:hypothetical protein
MVRYSANSGTGFRYSTRCRYLQRYNSHLTARCSVISAKWRDALRIAELASAIPPLPLFAALQFAFNGTLFRYLSEMVRCSANSGTGFLYFRSDSEIRTLLLIMGSSPKSAPFCR